MHPAPAAGLVVLLASSALAQPGATVLANFRAHGVSADGRVVVGQDGSQQAAYWTRESGVTTIGAPAGYSQARAVAASADGSVIIGNTGPSYYTGWKWTPAAGFTYVTVPDATRSTVTCISRDGGVVGGACVVPPDVMYQSFVWTAADGGRKLPGGSNYATWLYGLSHDGSQGVGSGSSGSGTRAMFWPSTYTWCVGLGAVAGANNTYAMAATPDSATSVGQSSTNLVGNALIWRGGEPVPEVHPAILGRSEASLRCVNDAGDLAGGFVGPGGGIAEAAIVWRAGQGLVPAEAFFASHGITTPPGLQYLVGMSADGRVLAVRTNNGSVIVHLPTCGSADFNGDGDHATDADIEAFFACLAGDCCPGCGSGDFNGDGDAGTDADIESFFRVLAGGAC